MERLTERTPDGVVMIANYGEVIPYDEITQNVTDKLAGYEDAEEEGRLIISPMSVGETIWIVNIFPESIEGYTIRSIMIDENGEIYAGIKEVNCDDTMLDLSQMGDRYFKTAKEAEAKLKEMEAGDD